MKIIFDCLGFHSTEVYITDVDDSNSSIYHIGYLISHRLSAGDEYEFDPYGIYLKRFEHILPTKQQIIEEYKRQYAEKGVCLNPNNIAYAG